MPGEVNDLSCVAASDHDVAWIADVFGRLFSSDLQGSWQERPLPFARQSRTEEQASLGSWRAIDLVDRHICWLAGESEHGDLWVPTLLRVDVRTDEDSYPIRRPLELTGLFSKVVLHEGRGLAIGSVAGGGLRRSIVYETFNGNDPWGGSWQREDFTSIGLGFSNRGEFTDLKFSSDGTAWLLALDRLLRKEPGGDWLQISDTGGMAMDLFDSPLLGAPFVWIALPDGSVVRSLDGGQTWQSPVRVIEEGVVRDKQHCAGVSSGLPRTGRG